jgi:hypothetical protein
MPDRAGPVWYLTIHRVHCSRSTRTCLCLQSNMVGTPPAERDEYYSQQHSRSSSSPQAQLQHMNGQQYADSPSNEGGSVSDPRGRSLRPRRLKAKYTDDVFWADIDEAIDAEEKTSKRRHTQGRKHRSSAPDSSDASYRGQHRMKPPPGEARDSSPESSSSIVSYEAVTAAHACAASESPIQGRSDKTSRFRGVSWDPQKQAYKARVYHEGKEVCLGHFDTEEDAAKARDTEGGFTECKLYM